MSVKSSCCPHELPIGYRFEWIKRYCQEIKCSELFLQVFVSLQRNVSVLGEEKQKIEAENF